MKICFVNPNSTAEMTRRMVEQARRHAPPGTSICGATNSSGPPSIQGSADGAAAEPGTLALLAQGGFDTAVIGCFDDTGIQAARRSAAARVIGLGEASYIMADRLRQPFFVLTTSQLSVPVLAANVQAYGLARHCAGVCAANVPVLDLEYDRAAATDRLISAGLAHIRRSEGIQTVVLGCAGMGGLAGEIAAALGIQAIDPVAAAVALALEA